MPKDNHLLQLIQTPFLYPFSIEQRIHVLYLGAALFIAYWVYRRYRQKEGASSFIKFCFPGKIYGHFSSKADFWYFIPSRILLLLLGPYILSSAAASLFLKNAAHYYGWTLPVLSWDIWIVNFLYTFASFLAADFAFFITHYWSHKISFLWEFHKVHHSAEVLTPMTVYRMHPVDDIFTMSVVGLFIGLSEGIFSLFFPADLKYITIFGFNALYFIYYLLGYNLRHSHVWFSYGPFFSRIFISPAQHQIHHSKNAKHVDKNFGFVFAFWDGLLTKSLIVPKEKIELELGLRGNEAKEFSNALKLFYLPFKKVLTHKP